MLKPFNKRSRSGNEMEKEKERLVFGGATPGDQLGRCRVERLSLSTFPSVSASPAHAAYDDDDPSDLAIRSRLLSHMADAPTDVLGLDYAVNGSLPGVLSARNSLAHYEQQTGFPPSSSSSSSSCGASTSTSVSPARTPRSKHIKLTAESVLDLEATHVQWSYQVASLLGRDSDGQGQQQGETDDGVSLAPYSSHHLFKPHPHPYRRRMQHRHPIARRLAIYPLVSRRGCVARTCLALRPRHASRP
jgi:hypothetical protein